MTQSSSLTPSLHSVLASALASLDAPLETELALYRRQRTSTQASALVHQPQTQDADPSVASALPYAEHAPTHLEDLPPAHLEEHAPTHLEEPLSELSPDDLIQVPSAQRVPPMPEVDERLEEPAAAQAQSQSDDSPHSQSSRAEQSSLVRQPVNTSESFEHYLDPAIEDYLESSEGLLQHLEDSSPIAALPTKDPITPVKTWGIIGAVAVVMLGCVGFVLFNTTNISQVFTSSTSDQPASTPPGDTTVESPSAPSPTRAPSSKATQPPTSATPKGPDLSSQEFVDLNLSNLGKVDPQSGSGTAPGTGAPSGATATTTAPGTAPTTTPGTTPSPGATSSPGNTRSFYVVSDYTGQDSLDQARRIVPNAYLTTFADGQRIQLATLYDFQKAKEMAQSLRNKGLNATILASN